MEGEATAFVLGPQGFEEFSREDYEQPEWIETADFEVDWQANPLGDETRQVLDQVGRLLQRIVPHAPVHIIPRMSCCPKDGVPARNPGGTYGGMAFLRQHAIVLSADQSAWGVLSAALHEAWHLAEDRFTDMDYRIVRKGLVAGVELPDGYYDSVEERSARSFESWALYQLSRTPEPRMPSFRPGERTAEVIMWEVIMGRYRPLVRPITVYADPEPGILQRCIQALSGYARRCLA